MPTSNRLRQIRMNLPHLVVPAHSPNSFFSGNTPPNSPGPNRENKDNAWLLGFVRRSLLDQKILAPDSDVMSMGIMGEHGEPNSELKDKLKTLMQQFNTGQLIELYQRVSDKLLNSRRGLNVERAFGNVGLAVPDTETAIQDHYNPSL